jgi:hypothetical protein
MRWHFARPSPTATSRDSNAAEFFAGSESAAALVRESIQNSLDASDDDPETDLEVRFTFKTLNSKIADKYFEDARVHFDSVGNGLSDIPSFENDCPILLVEDFGTTGLEGNENAARPPRPGESNNFFLFFRAEARTDKDAHKFGQRGVGKDVFVSASRVRSIFGLTIRESDLSRTRLVMGKSILKGHYASESDDDFFQDGFFGVPPDPEDLMTPVLPTTDQSFIDEFQSDFGIDRISETGLSVIVPWVAEDIDAESVAAAAIEHYFYPILRDRLRVVIRFDGNEVIIDSSTIHTETARLESDERCELEPLMALADWSRQQTVDSDFIKLSGPESQSAWKWSSSLISDDDADNAAKMFENGDRIAFRIPVTVTPRDSESEPTFFDVFLEQAPDRTGRVRPTFLRGDLLIADVRGPTCSGVRAIVLATDRPISGFLGSSENPAHTRWEHKRHRDMFAYGANTCLEFVKNIVSRIVTVLTQHDTDADRTIFADLFPSPPDDEAQTRKRKTRTARQSAPVEPADTDDIPELPPKRQRYRLIQTEGGFRVVSVSDCDRPDRISVRAAYNVRRGNAFKKYDRGDFRFNSASKTLDIQHHGCELILQQDNRIELCPTDDEFELTVEGFDLNRDLIVRHNAKDELGVESAEDAGQ